MPVPSSLGTPDGFFNKTNKAALVHYLLEDTQPIDLAYPEGAFFIQDGMGLLHTLKDLPPTFGDVSLLILDQMIAKKNFLFSTDCYFPNQSKHKRG